MPTIEEWRRAAEKGTSGDMVYGILCDWQREREEFLEWQKAILEKSKRNGKNKRIKGGE